MQLTSNLGLKKPEGTDVVDIADLNANADILDTEIPKLATSSQSGRMSPTDKSKLDGIQAGAQVNAVTSVASKTGAVTLSKSDVGLSNVDNTSDTNKPVSNAQQAALNLKANQADLNTHLADNALHIPHLGTTTNTGNAYAITSTKTVSAGYKFSVTFNVMASAAATLLISSIGSAKPLVKPGGGNFLPKQGVYMFFYDGANFQLLGEGGEYGNVTADKVLAGTTFGTENGLATGTIPVKNPDLADSVLAPYKMVFNNWEDGKNYALMNGITNTYFGTNVGWIRTEEPDLVASNILAGKSIFGQAGTAVDGAGMKKFASGNVSVSGGTYGTVVINGLDFTPAFIAVCKDGGDEISFYNSGTLNKRLRRDYGAAANNAIFNIAAGTFSFSAYNEYTSGYYWFATN